jgi:hypothetical protein
MVAAAKVPIEATPESTCIYSTDASHVCLPFEETLRLRAGDGFPYMLANAAPGS